ncbi:MAG TPA: hypothetical protein EYQ50_27540, partial [Verrucomicrobiales bacterium]|nr:hypothetical protein [Verrucomicrobiales bacterium]
MPKPKGWLIQQAADYLNLRLAFRKASRGKKQSLGGRKFASDLEGNLNQLRVGILNGDYPIGDYEDFIVYDPKRRVIHAPAFSERVLHHALMAVCSPCLDGALIEHSYACRESKGFSINKHSFSYISPLFHIDIHAPFQ